MSRSYLLPQGCDLVDFVRDLVTASGEKIEDCLVVFPGRRPALILAQRLAIQAGHALAAPRALGIDDYVAETAGMAGFDRAPIEAADGAALIWQLHPERTLPGGGAMLTLEEFLAWGFKLFADFEELKLEGVEPQALAAVEALAGERLPEGLSDQLQHLGQWYGDFYRALEERGLFTRSSAYDWVAAQQELPGLSDFKLVVAAGFYGLSGAECRILQQLLAHPSAAMVLRDGPGIGRTIKRLSLTPERTGAERPQPEVGYLSAGDSHGQALAAAEVLAAGAGSDTAVLVLPRAETVFPVIHHLLPRLAPGWNVSMGYPLSRTPLANMLDALAALHEGRQGGRYFLPHYLALMLHPYVKNLSLDGASYPTRIMLHAIEEELNSRGARLIEPGKLSTDAQLREEIAKRIAGTREVGADQLLAHLEGLHRLVIDPFEDVPDVAGFASALQSLVSAVAEHSPAQEHPYAAGFFRGMLDALEGLRTSLLAAQKLSDIRSYFALLDRFLAQQTVPLPGTPLAGLQVLGFLETRSLRFDRVVALDVNEGVLPQSSAVETLLPQALRLQLGLPTTADREQIDAYHFENLIRGARQVTLCYSQGEGAQRSRLAERLVWRTQQRERELSCDAPRLVHFRASFSQDEPEPIAKTPVMRQAIANLTYSASMLDCYLHCGRKFCHRYLMRIREHDEVASDIDASELGTAVHLALAEFFGARQGRKTCEIAPADFPAMDAIVDRVFAQQFGGEPDGNTYLVRSQVRTRLRAVLAHHRGLPPFAVAECEQDYPCTIELDGCGSVPAFGRIDRVDRRGDQTVIVDYKTGGAKFPSFDRFAAAPREEWPHWLRSVQMPFYLMLYQAKYKVDSVAALNSELMMLRERPIRQRALFGEGADRAAQYQSYQNAIATLVREIRDPALPFADTWSPQQECPNCEYRVLCGRQWVSGR